MWLCVTGWAVTKLWRHHIPSQSLKLLKEQHSITSSCDVTLYHWASSYCILKVKCTLVQALRLCTGRTARRGSRVIALTFHDHSTRRGWGVSVMPRPLFTPIVQEAGWVPVPVWTHAENLAPTGIRSSDRPACSQSLYQLCYPVHVFWRHHNYLKCWDLLNEQQSITSQKMRIFVLAMLVTFIAYFLIQNVYKWSILY